MAEKLTLEQANKQLGDIVKKMESGELSLEESMNCYKEAFKLLEFCYKQLDECKLQITDINERIEAMKNSGEPFEE